jgi:hypothetical protein
MIARTAAQSEEASFQDGIAFVPPGQRKADELPPVADSSEAIFVPAISARPHVRAESISRLYR